MKHIAAVMALVAHGVFPTQALAGTNQAEAVRNREEWSSHARPLGRGQLDVRLGGGVQHKYPQSGPRSNEPGLIFDVRYGLTDWLEIRFPVILSFTVLWGEGVVPTLVISGGVQGIGWSEVYGLAVVPRLGLTGIWDGAWWLVFLSIGANTALDGSTTSLNIRANVSSGVVLKLAESVSAGLAVVGSTNVVAPESEGEQPVGFGIGGLTFAAPVGAVPSIRIGLPWSFSLEGWVAAALSSNRGVTEVGGGISLAWMMR